jgi:hypothetical protein
LANPLVVLRKVNMAALDRATKGLISNTVVRHQGSANSIHEGELPWFEDGYVLNDQPREFDLTKEIMGVTMGFAVARTDNGIIMAEFDDLHDAEAAKSGATVQLYMDVNVTAPRKSKKEATASVEA